jgi:hypothetical protein
MSSVAGVGLLSMTRISTLPAASATTESNAAPTHCSPQCVGITTVSHGAAAGWLTVIAATP